MQYVEFVHYKLYMFANMFANLNSVRLETRSTIFMFVSKSLVNDEFANTFLRSRTISVWEPCLPLPHQTDMTPSL